VRGRGRGVSDCRTSPDDLLRTATALALGASAGLNITLPLFLTGLLDRCAPGTLSAPYSHLSSPPVLVVLIVLIVGEFLAGKLTGVATVLHLIQSPAAIVAGAFLTASGLATLLTPRAMLGAACAAASGWPGLGAGHAALSLAEGGAAALLVCASLLAPALGALRLLALFRLRHVESGRACTVRPLTATNALGRLW
jgi:hypothetical protein